ncbi:hypothetical protein GCM10022223_50940 [Kineosporia mesophila]|uniref:Uncharacterized protein n=1 Tax=Kineosporia mesophila TaxID=566012 RepID=A0ABP7A9K2_9ACTN|nr:hypothetical protein [Kineosporia mesophila]MCD5355151.1 hypothetical protein [Kineosporia mesophila]
MAFLARELSREPQDIDRLPEYCRDSFIGIVAMPEGRFRIRFTDGQTGRPLEAIRSS